MLILARFELCFERHYHLTVLQNQRRRSSLAAWAPTSLDHPSTALPFGVVAEAHKLLLCLLPFASFSDFIAFWMICPSRLLVFVLSATMVINARWDDSETFNPHVRPALSPTLRSRISTRFGSLRPQRRMKPLAISSTILSIKFFLPLRHMFARGDRIEITHRSDAVCNAPNRFLFGMYSLHLDTPKRGLRSWLSDAVTSLSFPIKSLTRSPFH